MPVVLLIAGLVVLVAVVYVATGRGGELSAERADYAPLDLGPVSATDVALLRPPSAMWGYDMQATEDALDRIAETIRERDVRIMALEQLVTDLSRDPAQVRLGSVSPDTRHRGDIEPPARTGAAAAPGTPAAAPTAGPAPAPGPAPVRGPASDPEPGRGRERATSAPPTWPLTPMRSVPAEATRPQAAQPRSPQPRSPQPQALRQPEQQPGAQEPGQQQQQPPPERSHG